MDPEQTFLRVHARLSGMLAQLISPRLRGFLEHLCLIVAILLLALLAVMHVNFVSQAGCAKELSQDQIADAELLQIKMVEQGLWSHKPFSEIYTTDQASFPKESGRLAMTKKSWLRWILSRVLSSIGRRRRPPDATNGMNKYSLLTSDESAAEGEAALLQLWDSWTLYSATWLAKVGDAARRFAKFWRNAGRELLFSNAKDGSHAFSQKEPASVIEPGEGSDAFEPVYLYSVERGYLLLPEDAKIQHNIRTINISMSARNPCFGNRWQQLLINSLVGYDTILMNSLLEARGEGYLYNYQTKELYDLNYPREAKGAPSTFQGYVISKCGVLIMSLFVFFTTTMSVSFTLRETQARMLKFTVQLQYHARHRLPTFRLIFVHVIESLVFVPIMIGILFFLFEFYEDQLLAFMVLTLVWLCELFTMISVRTAVSMQYFPRYFFLYFMVFHIYFFSYEYGFSYLAFSTTAAFMQHLVLYFWNHFEVPALQRFMRARMVFQQPGVQITSSAIITSTFHVSRVPPSNIPSTAEESARNLTFLRHLRRPAGDHMNSNTSAFSQIWPTGSVDRWWLENWSNWNTDVRSRVRTQNSAVDHNRNATENLNRDPNRPLNDASNTTQDPLRESQATGQQSFQAPTSTAMPQAAALNSFASILLWILGGPSEHLLSYLPIFREANTDNNTSASIQAEVPQGPNDSEQGAQGLRRRARNVSEGDHQTM